MPVVVGPSTGTPVLVSELIERTRRLVMGSFRQEINAVGATNPVGVTDTAITFQYPLGSIAKNAYLAIDDEIVFVFSTSGQVATVQRGMLGTVGAPHAVNALVEVNARYPRFSIKQALLDEIRSWEPQLYATGTLEIPIATGVRGYDMAGIPPDFLNILDMRVSPQPGKGQLIDVGVATDFVQNSWPAVSGWSLQRQADATSFPSGAAVFLGQFFVGGQTLWILYSKRFITDPWTDGVDVIAGVGLLTRMVDIPPYGAAARLLYGREVRRDETTAMPEPGRLQELPALATLNTARGFQAFRDQRIAQEVNNLRATVPLRMSWGVL